MFRNAFNLLCVLASVVGCAHAGAPRQCTRISVNIVVEGERSYVEPGVPIHVIVRSMCGKSLAMTTTGTDGQASLAVCWSPADPPAQIETTMPFGVGFVGSVTNFDSGVDAYCLSLPTRFGAHCGEKGSVVVEPARP